MKPIVLWLVEIDADRPDREHPAPERQVVAHVIVNGQVVGTVAPWGYVPQAKSVTGEGPPLSPWQPPSHFIGPIVELLKALAP